MKISDLINCNIIIAPFNDISVKLRDSLLCYINFCGFVDNYKTGEGIYGSHEVPEFDLVIINSPNYWLEISSNFDSAKVYLYNKAGHELIGLSEYKSLIEQNNYYDVLLFGFNKSNIYDLSIIARELNKINITAALVDIGSDNDINIREGLAENTDIPVVLKDQVVNTKRLALLASIDWDSGFGRPFLKQARKNGELTIGIVDGIEDFEDSDYDYQRNAYNTVEFVLLMGKDDQSHLAHKRNDTSIVGLPKMWSLFNDQIPLPKIPHVMINVNFTYGTFEEEREDWVEAAIASCEASRIPYIISQHHADNGVFPSEIISPDGVYETIQASSIVISRFSTVILESLAMGRQVIYFNPHGESVKLYAEPNGAYHIAKNIPELVACLQLASDHAEYGKAEAYKLLDKKCNVSSTVPPGKLAAYRIKNLIEERELISLTPAKSYEIDHRYSARKAYHHYNDQDLEDEWQLEVYLHALGLMVKNDLSSIADVGCGSGFKLMTYFNDYHTTGYELPVNVAVLEKKYPQGNWRVSNFDANDEVLSDVIICSDVIEHLVDPDELLLYLSRQSFKYLILSTPVRELAYTSDDPAIFGPPRNFAHQREWSFDEFGCYISKFFNVIDHRITNYHQATQMIVCKLKVI